MPHVIKHFILVIVFVAAGFNSLKAQFQQKFTLNASVVNVVPEINTVEPIYSMGIGIDGGMQYNINRRFSAYASARFYYLFGEDEIADEYYDNLALGVGLKFNILPGKVINPYLFAEANINSIWYEKYVEAVGSYPAYYDEDFFNTIGSLCGLGFDINFSSNFSVFLQAGGYYTYNDLLNGHIQAGVRINMFKSKSI